jgi:hypothetical protein
VWVPFFIAVSVLFSNAVSVTFSNVVSVIFSKVVSAAFFKAALGLALDFLSAMPESPLAKIPARQCLPHAFPPLKKGGRGDLLLPFNRFT